MLARILLILLLLPVGFLASPIPAAAQSATLSDALGGFTWGMTSAALLASQQETMMVDYRASIAGMNDPIAVDRMRREADVRFNVIRDSLTTFDTPRTGYEVSVIAGEIAGGRGHSMVTLRDDVTTRFFVFHNDQLRKLMVVYDLPTLDFIGFEGFVERLGQLFGRPEDSAYATDDIGRRTLTRVSWSDRTTRLRAVDRSQMFASYLLVYTDSTIADETIDVADTARATRPSGGRNLGDMVRRLESQGPSSGASTDIVDQITGRPVEVDLTMPGAASTAPTAVEDPNGAASALDDEEELEDGPRRTRPERERARRPATETEAAEEEEEGLTIY